MDLIWNFFELLILGCLIVLREIMFIFRYYNESLLIQIKDLDLHCVYEATDFSGEQSVLNLCNIDDIRCVKNTFSFVV